MYVCLRCGKDIKLDENFRKIRCPFCGYKVLTKKRGEIVRTVKAR